MCACRQQYALSNMSTADLLFKAKVVNLILSKDTEEALQLLSQHYNVAKPNLKVARAARVTQLNQSKVYLFWEHSPI
jgi:hypothetical protein